MALEEFIPQKLNPAHLFVVKQANAIIKEYGDQGFGLTLRQLHYQFVARDLYQNTPQNYKRLGVIVDRARKGGLLDWDAIEDRTRGIRRISVHDKPETPLERLARTFKLDPWLSQPDPYHVEVWVEKDAAVGIVQPTCDALRIPYYSNRGYSSSSGLYDAGKRLAAFRAAGYKNLILYLGDHDPSGVQMGENAQEKVDLYARQEIEFRRIALTLPQVEQYSPPPNYVKETDSRTKWYEEKFETDECWELDALSPKVVDALIREHVDPLIDKTAWDATMEQEKEDRKVLTEITSDWNRTKAAPAMLDLLRHHASFTVDPPTAEFSENGDNLQEVIDGSYNLLEQHKLRFDD